jgi:hypothetical protein
MKWIGQHIWDFISRFRHDVYLESLSTTTETNVLVVDSDGKVSKNTSAADKTYKHTQGSSSASWVVTHNLDKYPSVTVVDSAGTVVIGIVDYNSLNRATITFKAAFSGKAYFN